MTTEDPLVAELKALEKRVALLTEAARALLVVLDGGPRMYEAEDLDAAADDLRLALQ